MSSEEFIACSTGIAIGTTEPPTADDVLDVLGIDKRILGFTQVHAQPNTNAAVIESVARLIQFILSITKSDKVELLESISGQVMQIVRDHIRSGIDGMTLEELCQIAAPAVKPKKRARKTDGAESTTKPKRSKKKDADERIGEDGKPIVTDQ